MTSLVTLPARKIDTPSVRYQPDPLTERLDIALSRIQGRVQRSRLCSFRHCPRKSELPRNAVDYRNRLAALEHALCENPPAHAVDVHVHDLLLLLAPLAYPPSDLPQHLSQSVTSALQKLR